MSWLRHLRRRLCRCRRDVPAPPVTIADAEAARAQVEEQLAAARAREPQVRDVARRLYLQRTENHFGPMFGALLRGEADGGV